MHGRMSVELWPLGMNLTSDPSTGWPFYASDEEVPHKSCVWVGPWPGLSVLQAGTRGCVTRGFCGL